MKTSEVNVTARRTQNGAESHLTAARKCRTLSRRHRIPKKSHWSGRIAAKFRDGTEAELIQRRAGKLSAVDYAILDAVYFADYEFIICATRGGQLPWSDPTAMGQAPKYKPGGNPSHRTKDGTRVNAKIGTGTSGHANGDLKTVKHCYIPPEIANPGNVIHCSVGGQRMGDAIAHENEAPYSEELAEFFIRSFCPPGGIVCDPFSGSGTTAKIALTLGRRFRGCDVREESVLQTKQRIIEAKQLFGITWREAPD